MKYELVHIYGPFSIYSYGLAITIGLLVFTYLFKRDPHFSALHLHNKFTEILLLGILAALVGGRLLHLVGNPSDIQNFSDFVAFWQGGFSILGSIIGVLITVPWYLRRINVPILPFFDLAALYGPLLQSISRIGCFFAGCCHGIPATVFWGIVYKDPDSIAPLHICLHPTQLYSSFILLLIFLCMYFVLQKFLNKPGQLMTMYLIFASTERFGVDFWRADRTFPLSYIPFISLHQWVALVMFISASIAFIYISIKSDNPS